MNTAKWKLGLDRIHLAQNIDFLALHSLESLVEQASFKIFGIELVLKIVFGDLALVEEFLQGVHLFLQGEHISFKVFSF